MKDEQEKQQLNLNEYDKSDIDQEKQLIKKRATISMIVLGFIVLMWALVVLMGDVLHYNNDDNGVIEPAPVTEPAPIASEEPTTATKPVDTPESSETEVISVEETNRGRKNEETTTIELVEIVDESSSSLELEITDSESSTPINELTPGVTYELTGVIDNASTVETNWVVKDLTTTPGINIAIADPDGEDAPVAPGESVDVAQFGITIEVDQNATGGNLNFTLEFTATEV